MDFSHAGSTAPSPPDARHVAAVDVLDLDDLRDRAGGDESLVHELISDFLESGVAMSALRAAVDAQAFGEVGKLAHRLRGALLALGAKTAGKGAGEVEHEAAALASGSLDATSVRALSIKLDELGVSVEEARAAMRAIVDGSSCR
jgi:HPt (histidine-containing phosphotransfer) domain-containing protein